MLAKVLQHPTTDDAYATPWYSLNTNRLLATPGALKEDISCDVCVIGGGLTGISAAMELSLQGHSVVLLEAHHITDSAAGKNGGHLLRGTSLSPRALARKFDPDFAKVICNLTLEALAHIIVRVSKHEIKCDLKFGHVTAAGNPRQAAALKRKIDEWAEIGHTDLQYLDESEISGFVGSRKYIGGLFDPKGAQFHPLNYALGIAQAAQGAGCKIHDETPALAIQQGERVRVTTPEGAVNAKFAILAGHTRLLGMAALEKNILTMTSHMIATEPLDKALARELLPRGSAVMDSNAVRSHFQLSYDNRLLFGASRSFGRSPAAGHDVILRKRMIAIFPQLAETKITHCWGGPLDITFDRLPVFGRLGPNIFYAHGYYTNGIILGTLAGKLIAEAVNGTAGRFDVFAKMKHMPFIGGDAVKAPLFALDMARRRLQDLLF